jgi:hypothetical protein
MAGWENKSKTERCVEARDQTARKMCVSTYHRRINLIGVFLGINLYALITCQGWGDGREGLIVGDLLRASVGAGNSLVRCNRVPCQIWLGLVRVLQCRAHST